MVNRLSPGRALASIIGTGLPIPHRVLIGRGIVASGHPYGAAAGLPGIVLVLPGLAARLARRRDRVFEPKLRSSCGIKRSDPVANAAVAARRADDDLVLDRQNRAGDLQLRQVLGEVRLPHDFAGVLIGGDDARWRVGRRDYQIAPEGGAPIGRLPLLLGVHAPNDAAGIARRDVDLVEYAPGIGDVEEAIFGECGRLVVFLAGRVTQRNRICKSQPFDVALVDRVERREALRVIGAVIYQPIVRLLVGIDEPLRRHLGRDDRQYCGEREHRYAGECEAGRPALPHGIPPSIDLIAKSN